VELIGLMMIVSATIATIVLKKDDESYNVYNVKSTNADLLD